MPKISDPWDHHDWDSRSYVSRWAERQDGREVDRAEVFRLMAKLLPYDREEPIRILDVGAGYGALTKFLLASFPNATAVCQDGSEEMAKLGRKRMNHLKGRFEYVLCDFGKEGWSRVIKGPFEVVVSAIAIHNVRLPATIREIYRATFTLVKSGGCFLNFDRMRPSQQDQIEWLQEAGYENTQCFWDGGKRALVGGFKK